MTTLDRLRESRVDTGADLSAACTSPEEIQVHVVRFRRLDFYRAYGREMAALYASVRRREKAIDSAPERRRGWKRILAEEARNAFHRLATEDPFPLRRAHEVLSA